ncbi:MAG: hypothetical protein M3Y24_12785 [Acidobacteriota bacterium]|nr:hypothetical protein [Acidobacteriota bacterium]
MPVTAANTLQFYWKDASVPSSFRSGVSLHSHTLFSEESLDMVPRYTARVPYLGRAVTRQQAEYNLKTGQHLDFRHAFWTPPLTPRQAYRLEEKQIQRKFRLPAMVSLTDHDDSRAASLLRVLHQFRNAPVSTEWTIPFGPTFFHLGIHNMRPERALEMQADFARFTANPNPKDLAGYLEYLQSCPDLLIVLNHPLWDEKRIGREAHRQVLSELLRRPRALHPRLRTERTALVE